MQKTLFIGGGNMAFAILGGLISSGVAASTFHAVDPSAEAASKISALNIQCTPEWPSNFTPEIVVLAVKPQLMQSVLNSQGANLHNKLIISIAAGVSVAQIQQWSQQPNARVVRCMPNTPALVSQGISGLFFTANCSEADRNTAGQIFSSCGEVLVLNKEEEINAVTAISGSGPGYVFFLMEALSQAAKNLGFNEAQANLLVSQTFLGAATLAKQSDDSFATLREKVTSKGGTTFAGLEQLRALGVFDAVDSAAKAACARAVELQKGAG
ncbi:MAG: pyrroline-5-carboxylate reductase [Burkholderiales bacterium]|jgi:pyrroline-5-carboxylate reductase|uniref:pyrroline-5-carboxylate reductase n=1 Tax=Limnobacter sp. TaxID=2003368 RepID=UPI0039BCB1E0|nr:pyrroline-5-carboxylate reductase [Burkholderiales bacterium]